MYTKFLVLISQILCDLKDKSWFTSPPPLRGNTSKIDQTKYCAFHRSPGHTTNDCTTLKRYLKELVKEGKCGEYVDKPVARLRQKTDVVAQPQLR
ncbi:hypothetical protein ACFX2J_019940 [Malus domestica]